MSNCEARRRRRRAESLARLALSIVTAKGEGRSLAHVAWSGLAALFYLLFLPGLGWNLIPSSILLGALAVLVLYDAKYLIIPDGPVIVLAVCGLAALLSRREQMPAHLMAAAAAYGALRLVDWIYEKLRGENGLGQGDATLFALAGLWLGPQGLPSCLLAAVASALLSALVLRQDGRLGGARQPIPFGPHLALGLWLVWAIGPLEPG